MLARGHHELPQTGSAHARCGLGVECRLDDGQVFQFERQSVGFEGFLKDGYIEIGCPQHVADRVAQAVGIAVDEFLHDVVVGHFHDIGQAFQPVDIHLFVVGGVHVLVVAVFVGLQVCFRVVEVEQTVEFNAHGFGQVDFLLLSLAVGNDNLVVFVVLGLHRAVDTEEHGGDGEKYSFLHKIVDVQVCLL